MEKELELSLEKGPKIWLKYEKLDETYGKEWESWNRIEKRKSASVAGRKLLRHLLLEKFHLDVSTEKDPIGILDQGKPFLVNHPEIHFNISHSENLAACAVAQIPLGLDIQFQKEGNWKRMAGRILTEEEWKIYETSGYSSRCFFSFWTKKESYLKYTGEGIRRELGQLDYSGVRFLPVELEEGYTGMVCLGENFFS